MSFLDLKGVSKSYQTASETTEVLSDINLSVAEREFVAIVGFSGTGKTTLISLLAGLIEAHEGGVIFQGKEIDGPSPDRGVVFQSYSLMPWLTVNGNVGLAVDTMFPDLSKADRAAKVAHYVGMVGLSHAAGRRPAEPLS